MGKRILIVEDEKNIVDILSFNLVREGYETLEAYDGVAGLQLATEQDPDLVLLDINMPGLNGIEVLRQMKEMRADLPIILCSAYPEYKQDFGSWASDDYVVKSANLDELKAVVRKHLG